MTCCKIGFITKADDVQSFYMRKCVVTTWNCTIGFSKLNSILFNLNYILHLQYEGSKCVSESLLVLSNTSMLYQMEIKM